MNIRLSYSHGKGWFCETQQTPAAPWIACSAAQSTIELAIGNAGLGRAISFPVTTKSTEV
jgi:hypothetical protein